MVKTTANHSMVSIQSLSQNCKKAERHYLSSSGNTRNTAISIYLEAENIF